MESRYRIVTWHGELKTVHYIMDWSVDTGESPDGAIVAGPFTRFDEVYALWLKQYKDIALN